jgi:MFS family permease
MMQRDSLGDFISVTVSVALLGLGLGTTMPLTALALASKGYGADVVGWITAATAIGGVVGTFLAPAASQRLGRRFAMIACLAFSAISLIPLQYTDSLPIWFVMRMLFGAAMAPMFVLGES